MRNVSNVSYVRNPKYKYEKFTFFTFVKKMNYGAYAPITKIFAESLKGYDGCYFAFWDNEEISSEQILGAKMVLEIED